MTCTGVQPQQPEKALRWGFWSPEPLCEMTPRREGTGWVGEVGEVVQQMLHMAWSKALSPSMSLPLLHAWVMWRCVEVWEGYSTESLSHFKGLPKMSILPSSP